MNGNQALELIGELPASQVRELWEVATPMAGTDLDRGIWFGRNAGMMLPAKLAAKHLVRRDYFCKLVLDGWGVNVRVRQDGTFTMLHDPRTPMAVRVDLPFVMTREGLDYALPGPLALLTAGRVLALRDYLRSISLQKLTEVVSLGQLRRVGGHREAPGEDEASLGKRLVLGYMAPLGASWLQGTPFGMVWQREPTPSEVESAERIRPSMH